MPPAQARPPPKTTDSWGRVQAAATRGATLTPAFTFNEPFSRDSTGRQALFAASRGVLSSLLIGLSPSAPPPHRACTAPGG